MEYSFNTEAAMIQFGVEFGQNLPVPITVELVGDVGAGKTTIARGIAKGLGLKTPISSPSFTIVKKYQLPDEKILAHYDFYRLLDPGLIKNDLAESTQDPHTITLIEWGQSVAEVLPARRIRLTIKINQDGHRTITEETLS